MHTLVYFLPLVSAFIGWCLAALLVKLIFHPRQPVKLSGVVVQGILPSLQKQFVNDIGRFMGSGFDTMQEVELKMSAPENLQRIMPEVEGHIDYFLRVKLKEAMPMIGSLIGERTTNQMKEIFLTELESLFPIIMKSYFSSFRSEFDLQKIITQKVAALPDDAFQRLMSKSMLPTINKIKIFGAVAGFVIGIIQLALSIIIAAN